MAVRVVDENAIRAAMADVLRPTNFSGWVLLHYVDDNTVGLQAQGNGGVEEVKPLLKPDQAQYLLIRFYEKKEGLDCNRDVYIAWTGPQVNKIKAAKKHTHFGQFEALLRPNHAQLTAININNFTEAVIRQKALPDSGSHIID
jgi:hypothetical protein